MNPFSQHTALQEQYENLTGGGTSLAMLTLTTLPQQVTVPCTHSKIDDTFELVIGGQSPRLMIETCEFRASFIPAANLPQIRRGLKCVLLPTPTSNPINLELYIGGLLGGAEIFRFMLRDTNYGA